MPEYLFSYGTLQKETVQVNLFGRTLKGFPDMLIGYIISPIEIKDEVFLSKGEDKNQKIAMLTNNPADVIEGTVFEVSEEELLFTDKYEPVDYKRVKVALASGKESWVYAAK